MLPVSFNGRIEIPGQHDATAACRRLHTALEELDARRIARNEHTIRFTGGVFRIVSNWNLLVPISSGKLVVRPHPKGILVLYRLRFLQFAAALAVLAAFLCVSLLTAGSDISTIWNGGMIWAFGLVALIPILNIFIAMIRFRRWVWRTLAHQSGRR